MKLKLPLCMSFIMVIIWSFHVVAADSPLQPWKKNPWYWSVHGEPLLLLGGSDDDDLFQWQEKDLLPQLDRLVAAGGNLIRNTMSSRKDVGFEVFPFKQIKEGQYDLNRWNDDYWIRFERMLQETAKRHIMVQIEIWDPWDYTGKGGERWAIHPYNPRNNINYTYEGSGFAEHYAEPAYHNKQPFFFTTPAQRNNQVVLQYQHHFVNKLMDYTLRYDHVLYCIDNEISGEEAWSRYWAIYIHRRGKRENRKIFLTEMWDNWDITTGDHRQTFDHPELYDFVEISQNNHFGGQKHWDQILRVHHYLADHPRPMNSIKVYGATGNTFGHTDQDGVERFWRHLLGGTAAIRFHRPPSGLGLQDKAVASIRGARKLESQIPLWTLEPANQLLVDRRPNQAYLSANKGRAFALYLPIGGTVQIDLSSAKEPLVVRWIEIATGEWGPEHHIVGGENVSLTSPGPDNWAAAIILESSKRPPEQLD